MYIDVSSAGETFRRSSLRQYRLDRGAFKPEGTLKWGIITITASSYLYRRSCSSPLHFVVFFVCYYFITVRCFYASPFSYIILMIN